MASAIDPKPMSRATAILYAIGSPLFLVALVFVPAGRIDWIPGWIFIAVLVGAFSFSALLIARVNPIIFRARSRFQPGTRTWDLVLLAVLLPAMVAEIPVATLDAGRMRWSDVPLWVVLIGYVLLIGSIAVTTWAQAVNPYFEVLECHTRREDYQRTTGEWQRRLRLNEKLIRQKWGDKVFEDYDRYLGTCVRAFDIHYSSLAQMELERID